MCYINHILINTNCTVLQATSALAGLLEEDAIASDESKIIDNAWRGAEVWFCDLVFPLFVPKPGSVIVSCTLKKKKNTTKTASLLSCSKKRFRGIVWVFSVTMHYGVP